MTDTEDPEVMADIIDEAEDEEEGEDFENADSDELFHDIYVETATNTIYEVQFINDFVLARPASPTMYAGIVKMGIVEFSKRFHEYGGDPEAVRDYLRTAGADFIVE